MKHHGYLKRLSPIGEVDGQWRCQAEACGAEGTLKEVLAVECKAPPQNWDEMTDNLIRAIEDT